MPRSGLSFDDVYGWREAAHWARLDWADFCELPSHEQSTIVAHWMAHMQAEAVVAQDMERKRQAAARWAKGKS